jgi:hypothetical protein
MNPHRPKTRPGPVLFVIGPPRSGTTMLGNVIGRHGSIVEWFEPYFIWDRFFRDAADDQLEAGQATPEIANWIREQFNIYRRRAGVDVVVEKSPRNCLKLPFIKKVFPEARFVFILREGGDTVLSLMKKHQKRRQTGQNGIQGLKLKADAWRYTLGKQPFMKHRLMAARHELGGLRDCLKGNFLHKARWQGKSGWGPRFKNWQDYYGRIPLLDFCLMQWERSVLGILEHFSDIPASNRLAIRYEDFVQNPNENLQKIFKLCGLPTDDEIMTKIQPIRTDRVGVWEREFSKKEKEKISAKTVPLINQAIAKLDIHAAKQL